MEFYNLSNNILSLEINDEIGFWGINQQSIKTQIDSNPDKDIKLNISSLGGDVNHAFAIYNMLKSHKGMVTANIYGDAASAATLIALGADKVNIAENVFFMIHNVWTMAVGDSGELRKTADLMDKINDQIVDAYKKKTGLRRSEIKELMNNETWFTAEEAKAKGFVDKVVEPSNILNRVEAKIYNSLNKELANGLINKININQKSLKMELNEKEVANSIFAQIKDLFKKEEVTESKVVDNTEVIKNAVAEAIATKEAEINAMKAEMEAKMLNAQKELEAANEAIAKAEASKTVVASKEDTEEPNNSTELEYTQAIKNIVKKLKNIK